MTKTHEEWQRIKKEQIKFINENDLTDAELIDLMIEDEYAIETIVRKDNVSDNILIYIIENSSSFASKISKKF